MSDETRPNPQNSEEQPTTTPAESTDGGAFGPNQGSEPKKKILIGSQRDPGVPQARKERDWVAPKEDIDDKSQSPAQEEKVETESTQSPTAEKPPVSSPEVADLLKPPKADSAPTVDKSPKKFPVPSARGKLSPELEAELEEMLADESLEDLMSVDDSITRQEVLERETHCNAKVVAVREEDIFVELIGREQGILAKKNLDELPAVGDEIEVVVNRFNREDGLYEVTLPGAAAEVADWSDLEDGMVVEARVTGHNTGGLECEVNHIRGFIPMSQISDYRVEDVEPFVGEKLTCLVTEANPDRRNLVLSRRAIIDREKEVAREQLLASLEPGQTYEGVVRKLMDFGAFVDLGGVDGLLHISQLGWGRVNHPSDVLSEGQTVKVLVQSIDPETKRISLSYRELLENPWDNIERNYPTGQTARGTVVKIMDFGAFVELEPGVEGLIHISELDHKRVFRTSDVVQEGQEVEVMVKSVDTDARRIGLSMKDTLPLPTAEKNTDEPADDEPIKPIDKVDPSTLKGGTGGQESDGAKFGLKW
jgi:ribosomal protein S1